jgi:hypothetical protein
MGTVGGTDVDMINLSEVFTGINIIYYFNHHEKSTCVGFDPVLPHNRPFLRDPHGLSL